jgi:hypothetical protein
VKVFTAFGVVVNVVALIVCVAALVQGTPQAPMIGVLAALNAWMIVVGVRNFRDIR